MPKKDDNKERVLIMDRRKDAANVAMTDCSELGFEAYAALTNEDALKLLDEKVFTCAAFGTEYKNAELWRSECDAMRAVISERNIRSGDMPFFGDVRAVLLELGLVISARTKGGSTEYIKASDATPEILEKRGLTLPDAAPDGKPMVAG